jgi:hypothetical protein
MGAQVRGSMNDSGVSACRLRSIQRDPRLLRLILFGRVVYVWNRQDKTDRQWIAMCECMEKECFVLFIARPRVDIT